MPTTGQYDGPRLLVPLRLEAMLVDYALRRIENGQWARSPADYRKMVLQKTAAFPRTNAVDHAARLDDLGDKGKGIPDLGVHIRWELPKGLRFGQQEEEGGDPVFPQVPNRWLVSRLWLDEDKELQMRFWLVQSDYLERGTNFLVRNPEDGKLAYRQIGKVFELDADQWPLQEGETANLSAVGMEDMTFNAYTINNLRVFSMVDSLNDLETIIDDKSNDVDHFDLSYMVSGWYEDPTKDPLYQEVGSFDPAVLLEKLEGLSMSIGQMAGLEAAELAFQKWLGKKPSQWSPLMLCQGGMHSIHWYGQKNDNEKKSNSESGKPKIDRNRKETIPGIIIANSSMDALIKFITTKLEEYDVPEEEVELAGRLIQAYEKGMLDEFTLPGGQGLLDRMIHQSWFDPEQSGSQWAVLKKREAQTEEEAKKVKRLYSEAMPVLGQLNQVQADCNRWAELYEAKQLELYTCLYASKKAGSQKAAWATKAKDANKALGQLGGQLQTGQAQIDDLQTQLKDILEIGPASGTKEDFFSLKQELLPPYWQVSDPVVLVHAAKTGRRVNFKEVVDCRYTGQTIESLRLHTSGENIHISIPDIPQQDQLPKEIPLLLEEFILLNPNLSDWIAEGHAKEARIQQTMIWNPEKYAGFDAYLLAEQAGFTGRRPSFVSFQTYTPPWSPLFLDWDVYFFQNQGLLPPDYPQTNASSWMDHWQLDDEKMDLKWDKTVTPPAVDSSAVDVYFLEEKGRSLLSSRMPQILRERLRELQQEQLNPVQRSVLETIVQLLDSFDIITQRLNGLNDLWLQYDLSNPMPSELLITKTSGVSQEALQRMHYGIPRGNPYYEGGEEVNRYFPLRSGYLLTHYVRITDGFGLGLYPNGVFDSDKMFISSDTEYIPKGPGMDNSRLTGDSKRMAQLPPRLLQAARMDMQWVDGEVEDKAPPVEQSENNSPLAGWILPNHLDKSLMVFDKDGGLEGSLIFYERNGKFLIREEVNPSKEVPLGEGMDIRNVFLKAFVDQLLSLSGDQGKALSAFLENIDVTSWITDPNGVRDKKGLSTLIGRPLALLRSRVEMAVKGRVRPLLDFQRPELYSPGEVDDIAFGLTKVPLPFYVGEDQLPQNGLIGYFDESDFSTFYVVTNHSEIENSFIEERSVLTVPLNDATKEEADRNYHYLTLLLDPRGVVHTVSGLLPTVELNLPNRLVEDALNNMDVTFRIGPLMVDPDRLRMPKPTDIQGRLSWLYRSGVNIWQKDQPVNEGKTVWENTNIEEANDMATFPNSKRNELAEGWLKLSDALQKNETPTDGETT